MDTEVLQSSEGTEVPKFVGLFDGKEHSCRGCQEELRRMDWHLEVLRHMDSGPMQGHY